MTWNATPCSRWQLYVVLDRAALRGRDPVEIAAAAIRGGADALQWRDKGGSARDILQTAGRLLPIARRADIPLIINDRADLARTLGADGVHLGQEDLPLAAARDILGPGRLIGTSTHSLEQAASAQADGADYLGFGPIFPTPTKPDYGSVGLARLNEISRTIHAPVVCIGGIDRTNVQQVIESGGRCIAVVRAVCSADEPESSARDLKQRIVQFTRPTPTPWL